MTDDFFEPYLGKIGNRGARSRRYAHQVLAAINRAGGRSGRRSRYTGSRTGRGGTMAAVLASRDRYASYRARRVIVKARIVKLAGKGLNNAHAHLRYIQREGVTREGDRGQIYGPDQEQPNGKDFLERSAGDRHQFRFIVAPEDGREYEDLKPLTRRLMHQMEQDLGTRLDWVAVDHYNTGHPHSHIMVRSVDDMGQGLKIAPSYISGGIRERAAELVCLDLGPRTDREIEMGLNAEMDADRLTSLDRQLIKMKENEKGVSPFFVNDTERQTLLAGRLKHLERLGLAEERRPGQWHLDDELEPTLRRMGERGDIIKTMHREITERNIARSPADYDIYDPTAPGAKPVVGRVIARGLSDELNDRHYLVVDSVDGRALYIDIGRGSATEPTPEGSIVRVTPKSLEPRKVDRTVAEVAAASDGRYNISLHMEHDQHATFEYGETHVRRLEAIRRATNGITREPDGTWIIAPDHLDRVKEYERLQAKRAPVIVDKLSNLSLEQQVRAHGATWLDRQLVSGDFEPTQNSGFGHEVRDALRQRQNFLIEQGLAQKDQNDVIYRANLLSTLRRREVSRVGGQLSKELGLPFAETLPGDTIDGTLRKSVELASGKFALVEKSREFTLVPWRSILEDQLGRQVSGIMHPDGISWTIGRQRGLGIG
jgi:type IV secretory pathway VirD2 relaxase